MPKHNGHHCWNCWNVALWIGNEEPLYLLALSCLSDERTLNGATWAMLGALPATTPDGARYTYRGVRNALAGLQESRS